MIGNRFPFYQRGNVLPLNKEKDFLLKGGRILPPKYLSIESLKETTKYPPEQLKAVQVAGQSSIAGKGLFSPNKTKEKFHE